MGKDDKFLFNLIDDVSEMNNLLISAPTDAEDVVAYALSLITPYMDHPLFSESIAGLWDYHADEDDAGAEFIHPWMSRSEYINEANRAIAVSENHHDNPIPDAIKTLYNEKWISPLILNRVEVGETDENKNKFLHSH